MREELGTDTQENTTHAFKFQKHNNAALRPHHSDITIKIGEPQECIQVICDTTNSGVSTASWRA